MAQSTSNGFLVIFDGIDGVGKTTQLHLAEVALQEEGRSTAVKRNLGGTPIGEELRQVIKLRLERPAVTNLYISAAIQEALIESMMVERQKHDVILMDRGPLSLAAYEIYGSGLEAELGWPQVDRGMRALAPDLTIIYTTDVETALKRARQSSEKADYFESKPLDYFERVAHGYQEASKRYDKVVLINANRPIEAVHEQTMELINQALNAHRPH